MSTTRWIAMAAGLGCLLLAGCQSGGSSDGPTTPAPTSTATSTTGSDAPGSGYPGPCPTGTWKLADLASSTSVDGGELTFSGGGSMTLTMTADGTWQLSDDGSQPLAARLVAAGGEATGTVTIRGSADGKYAKVGDQYGFQVEGSRGTAELKSNVINQTYNMDQVTSALVPSGQAMVSCVGTTLRINSGSFDMTWNYAGGAAGQAETPTAGPTAGPTTKDTGSAGAGVLAVEGRGSFDCAGRDVKVAASNVPVELTGTCGRVEINGSANDINVGSAATLTVNGSANSVEIGQVDTIEANGSTNRISWGASRFGGEPAVSTTGIGNVITRR